MSTTTPALSGTAAATALKALPAGAYRLAPGASEVRFRHRTLWGLVTVKGRFTGVTGSAEIPADGGAATGTLTIDAASIDTKHTKRDAHLRDGDFFDVERHPQLVFAATEARAQADGTVAVTGSLTVLGVTEPLAFTATVTGSGPDSVTLTGHTEIDRERFGLTWNRQNMLKGLTSVDVTVTFERA